MHSKPWLKYMKFKDPPHTATHNELYTSICTMSNKSVVRPSLAYERSFNHFQETIYKCQLIQKSKDSKIPSPWSFFMFSFQYDVNAGVTS